MATVRIAPNLAAVLAGSSELRSRVEDAANKIKKAVEGIVPRGPTHLLEGSVEVSLDSEGQGIVGHVTAGGEAYWATFVHFGTIYQDPQPFMVSGANAAGFEVKGA